MRERSNYPSVTHPTRRDIETLQPELPYRRGFSVYDDYESTKVVREVLQDQGLLPRRGEDSEGMLSPSAVQARISALKNGQVSPADYARWPKRDPIVATAFAAYEAVLRERNVIDYDDMLLLAVALLSKSDGVRKKYQRMWTHAHVDEFQDTNSVQYALLRLLVDVEHGNVFVVGDRDQAIYGWRGADERNQVRTSSRPGLTTRPFLHLLALPRVHPVHLHEPTRLSPGPRLD